MSLVFYYAPQSSAVTCHWALEELKVPYEKVKVDLASGQQHKPEFLAINPNGKVPVLVHDGTPIFESAAIVAYLGETFGAERGLYPKPGPRRGEALKWLVWTNVSVGEALSRYQHATSPRLPAEIHNAKAGEKAKADVERLFGVLDGALKGKSHLVGDGFTIVDAHVAGWVAYVGMCGFDTKRWAAITKWLDAVTARPAFGSSMAP